MTALPRAIPKHGPVKDRQRAHQAESRRAVFLRCRGVCEAPGCAAQARDWAHLFGRRHIVSEPWASSPELTAGLCRAHHNVIDRSTDPDLRDRLRWTAITRLADAHRVHLALDPEDEPLGVVRRLVEQLESEGVGAVPTRLP